MNSVGEAPRVRGAQCEVECEVECEVGPWKSLEAGTCSRSVQALSRAVGFSLRVMGSYLKILVKEREIIWYLHCNDITLVTMLRKV